MNRNTLTRLSLSAVLSLALHACGPAQPDPDAEACEHLVEGPAKAVTASETAPAAIGADHTRYDVTLVDVTGGKGGSVTFAADEATDFVFFLDQDVPVEFKTADGTVIAPEETAKSSKTCTEIRAKHTVPLAVGTVTVRFGPTTEALVGVVVEETGHTDE